MRHLARLLLFVGAMLATSSLSADAQVAQAELRGTITDESGGALPGSTVTATHVETGVTRTTQVSETGAYVMPALPIGTYTVKAELAGFTIVSKEGITLNVGQAAILNFQLSLATVQETITVTGEAPLVDTKRSALAGNIEQKQVENLPLNGRNWLDLVALVPGARGNPGAIQAGASGSDMAKYQMDGVDISNQCCAGANTAYSQENIAEFQVITNRFDAEYGRVNGAVINAVTKSGSNQFRGTGFGYFRNDKFGDAKNFFTDTVTPFDQKQTGINSGGPLLRNRAFYFGSFEYQKLSATARPNTGVPAFDVTVPADTTSYFTTARADFQLNSAHRLFTRFSVYNWEQLNNGVNGRTTVSGGTSRPSKNHDLSLGHTWVVSSRLVNELRAGFSAIDNLLDSNSRSVQLDFPSAVLGSPTNSPQWWKEMNIQVNNLLSYIPPSWHGDHAFKMGFQFFRPKFWGAFPDPAFGQFTFASDPTDFNNPATYPRPTRYTIPLGDTSYEIVNPTYGAFFQDNWTLNSHLTINLGVRYDLETGTTNSDVQSPIQPGERPMDTDNFSPRLGFAYDLRGDGTTVVRGGYGRYFDKVMLNLTSNERRQILGQIISVTIVNPNFNDPLGGRTYEDFKREARPGTSNLTLLDTGYQTPVNDQVSIGLAQQLGSRYAVQADVIYTKGKDEPMTPQVNFFEDPETHLPRSPALFGRPFPQYNQITLTTSDGKSEYKGLQVGFNGRGTRLNFGATYTLSKTLDNHNTNRGGTPTNYFNLDDDYTYSNSDQRHRFVANVVTALPYDIQFSAIYFAGSPRTINVVTTRDPFGLGYTGRWLELPANCPCTGATIPRNSERTKSDYKLDLRLAKTVRAGRMSFQGVIDVFNVLNTRNLTNYVTNVFSQTYLQASNSTNLFYQPRQVQLGFRITY
ncbi:MAG: TonB-dependent receptor domain-containing protein [Vicinamibacterales bacterium]